MHAIIKSCAYVYSRSLFSGAAVINLRDTLQPFKLVALELLSSGNKSTIQYVRATFTRKKLHLLGLVLKYPYNTKLDKYSRACLVQFS